MTSKRNARHLVLGLTLSVALAAAPQTFASWISDDSPGNVVHSFLGDLWQRLSRVTEWQTANSTSSASELSARNFATRRPAEPFPQDEREPLDSPEHASGSEGPEPDPEDEVGPLIIPNG
ncbi:MAG: hypothetical protein MPN21_09795 [Thermoanaerobaculia bacterium]|nr:hypothetical protein [Thermoanaerobaculia bacterium]